MPIGVRNILPAICVLAVLPGCSDPAAILVHIDAAGSEPAILAPDDVDTLRVTVTSGGDPVGSDEYVLAGAIRPLDESLTLVPGRVADGGIHIAVDGLRGAQEVATGAVDATFGKSGVVETRVHLAWLPGACIDGDGDGHGRGPNCLGEDCDDDDAGVHAGAMEACNGVDDDCDGETDEALDPPYCDLYRGVCRDARKPCGGELGWQACAISDYGEHYRDVEMTADCDGFDNDCDGMVDEGCTCTQGNTRPCSGPDEGECEPGGQSCVQVGPDWVWGDTCAGEVAPVDETCNLLDDDCDGSTDEGFDLQSDPGHCGACDSACNFANGSGGCQAGVCVLTGCDPGYHDVNESAGDGCEYACDPGEPPVETCDGADNDCDGETDNGLSPPACEQGTGVCAGAVRTCAGAGGWGECDYGPDYQAVEDRCDSLDNDCDGETDGDDPDLAPAPCEDQDGVCAGATHALSQCTPAGWEPCTASEYGADYQGAETRCDGMDNDCDGTTDPPAVDADCDDGEACTQDACLGGICRNDPIDGDGDGEAPESCGGTDCDDGDPEVNTGADERCDDTDWDCDGTAWDVAGSEAWTVDLTQESCDFSSSFRPGAVSVTRAPNGDIGVAWGCVQRNQVYAAVLSQDGQTRWVGPALEIDLYSASSRMAPVGQDAFIVTATSSEDLDHHFTAVFTSVDATGAHGITGLVPDEQIDADIETSPWDQDRVLALYINEVYSSPELSMLEIDSTPATAGSSTGAGIDSWCCAQISHELVYAADGLLAVGCDGNMSPLQARWIAGPPPAPTGTPSTWVSLCGNNPKEIRGAMVFPPAGRRAFVALVSDSGADLYMADAASTGSAALVSSRPGLQDYLDAAPIGTSGSGLAIVMLSPFGEVQWLASDGGLNDLAQPGSTIADNVDVIDAAAVGENRTGIVMGRRDGHVLLQVRDGTCATVIPD